MVDPAGALLHSSVRPLRNQTENNQFCFWKELLATSTFYDQRSAMVYPGEIQQVLQLISPDFAHQLNFQSAVLKIKASLRQWSDRVLIVAIRAFTQLPDVRLFIGVENRKARLILWIASPRPLMRRQIGSVLPAFPKEQIPVPQLPFSEENAACKETSEGDTEAEKKSRSQVRRFEKTLKQVIDSVLLGTQMTRLSKQQPKPGTSNC